MKEESPINTEPQPSREKGWPNRFAKKCGTARLEWGLSKCGQEKSP
jgi:hypothetical protein